MDPIDWPAILRGIIASGLTQPQVAAACRCGQSTISDMLNGNTKDPRTSTGLLLLALARQRGVPTPAVEFMRVASVAEVRNAA